MVRRTARPLMVLSAAALLLGACSGMPAAGDGDGMALEQAVSRDNPLGLHVVSLTPEIVSRLRVRPERFASVFDGLRSSKALDRLGPGDVIAVSIYEAGEATGTAAHTPGGDTTSSGGLAQTLPRLQVDRLGRIMVPYADQVRVAGHTLTEVRHILENRLAEKGRASQMVVSLVTNGSNTVYVSGDVRAPGRFHLTLAREQLLDVIALAGGPSRGASDLQVRLHRQGRTAIAPLSRIQAVPEDNIALEPQDRIQVGYTPRSYLTYGADGQVARVRIDAATVSLAEAVAQAPGSMNPHEDGEIDRQVVYLFRFERPATAQLLGIAPRGTGPAGSPGYAQGATDAGTPVVYRVSLRDPQTVFAMQRFPVEDKDLIYIASRPKLRINRFLQLIYTAARSARSASK